MVLPSSPESDHISASSKRLTLNFMMSISSLMALWAKRAGRVSIKLKKLSFKPGHHNDGGGNFSLKLSPKSPMIRSKELLTQISNKAITLMQSKKREGTRRRRNGVVGGDDEFGDGGVWQKSILMGDKCQPLDFSGVIYYDSDGKQLDEIPCRSPRASPLPGYYLTSGELK
ncbi:uncharacterized protein [Euphorbia lathyris]|uniref:uncharacterized protein n=1 Tax=Euphorbia lathyris TaxID=212925 RepID=UPI003313754E